MDDRKKEMSGLDITANDYLIKISIILLFFKICVIIVKRYNLSLSLAQFLNYGCKLWTGGR